MAKGAVVVLDVGKTLAKATLWSPERRMVERRSRPNERVTEGGLPSLDYKGIEGFLAEALTDFAKLAEVTAIVPVAHGAAAAVVAGQGLAMAPLDYEAVPPDEIKQAYENIRDPFAITGSPCLPLGLNLGTQLYWLKTIRPKEFESGRILTWPQYWAWRLCGVASIEGTSLGCHTDLWEPTKNRPSPMAVAQGFAKQFAPLHKAADVLGTLTPEWCARTGLPQSCKVLCGIHDSNAALAASRLHSAIANRECTVLSTGTWFIAMRTLEAGMESPKLAENRDCLFNVDAWGNPVPSSRFMGGREAEVLEDSAGDFVDVAKNGDALMRFAKQAVEAGVMALPAIEPGVGPFPKNAGKWIKRPEDKVARRAVAGLYLALMADSALNLIGAQTRIVIEGRFAGDPVFTRALASLRPKDTIYLSYAQDSLAFGALGLLDGTIPAQSEMAGVKPLEFDIARYAEGWRDLVRTGA